MVPAARDAQIDFVRLASEEPSSLYFEQFLQDGYATWPSNYRDRFSGLRCWRGVAGLKHSIRQLADAPKDWEVVFGSRSLCLVKLASSCMFRVCRNVLTTDLSWPTYQLMVEANATRTGNQVTRMPLRDKILYQRWSVNDVAKYLAEEFAQHECDGLYLPAVDHLGVRLPVGQIVKEIRARGELRFCFIDAAQAFCQVPLDDCIEVADFIVAGSHKWMGAYLPTGIGFFGQHRSREMVERRLRHMLFKGRYADPLLQFTEQLTTGQVDGYSQTANLVNLFACAGATTNNQLHLPTDANIKTVINSFLSSAPHLRNDWTPLVPHPEFQTRISLLRSGSPYRNLSGIEVRREWLDAGCIVSGYDDNLARISL